MQYPNAKKALNILLISILASLIGSLATGIVGSVVASIASVMTLVGLGIDVVCGILAIVAYGIGGKDSNAFHSAFIGEIFGLVIGILYLVFAVLFSYNATWSWANWFAVGCNALNNAIDILVFFFVCTACSEVCHNESISHLAKLTWGIFAFGIIASLVCSIFSNFNATFAGVFGIIATLAELLALVFELILIIRARNNVA